MDVEDCGKKVKSVHMCFWSSSTFQSIGLCFAENIVVVNLFWEGKEATIVHEAPEQVAVQGCCFCRISELDEFPSLVTATDDKVISVKKLINLNGLWVVELSCCSKVMPKRICALSSTKVPGEILAGDMFGELFLLRVRRTEGGPDTFQDGVFVLQHLSPITTIGVFPHPSCNFETLVLSCDGECRTRISAFPSGEINAFVFPLQLQKESDDSPVCCVDILKMENSLFLATGHISGKLLIWRLVLECEDRVDMHSIEILSVRFSRTVVGIAAHSDTFIVSILDDPYIYNVSWNDIETFVAISCKLASPCLSLCKGTAWMLQNDTCKHVVAVLCRDGTVHQLVIDACGINAIPSSGLNQEVERCCDTWGIDFLSVEPFSIWTSAQRKGGHTKAEEDEDTQARKKKTLEDLR